jgi:hypothetical protein
MTLLRLAPILLSFFGTLFVWFDTERISAAIRPGRIIMTDDPKWKSGIMANRSPASFCFSSGFYGKACASLTVSEVHTD